MLYTKKSEATANRTNASKVPVRIQHQRRARWGGSRASVFEFPL